MAPKRNRKGAGQSNEDEGYEGLQLIEEVIHQEPESKKQKKEEKEEKTAPPASAVNAKRPSHKKESPKKQKKEKKEEKEEKGEKESESVNRRGGKAKENDNGNRNEKADENEDEMGGKSKGKGKTKAKEGGEDGNANGKGFFKGIGAIKYEGPGSRDPLAFKYYDRNEKIMGKTMAEWLRFAVCYWHTWRGFGFDMFGVVGTIQRPWEDGSNSIENAIRRVRVHFEFLEKLGVDYYCFHDRDVAPEGATLEETNANLDRVVEVMKQEQERTGIKLLWGTANLFSSPIYMNGAATNPDAEVFARAAAQVKKAMEVTHKLGGENYVFWGGREGYVTLLNTDMKQELDHLASFLKMAVAHKEKIGATFQLLIEPKPREPTSYQYDFNAATTIGFLEHYGLDKHFKLNLEANHATLAGLSFEHEVTFASQYGKLGSLDANHDETLLGWDTDLFPTSTKMATSVMEVIVKQNGIQPGGLNFDCKLRRESTNIEDLFIGHINGMDTFARGLRNCAALLKDDILPKMKEKRYASYKQTDIGKKIASGKSSFEELEKYVLKKGPPAQVSGEQEKYESIFGSYL
jgi:xylose isomerase